jgi:UDP-N-acetyl-D-mannosaminuronic acid dehydrogenase
MLQERGIQVAVHDPYVNNAPTMPLSTLEECFNEADCLVILTDHNDYKYINPRQVGKLMRRSILFDTRDMLDHGDWQEAGFRVRVLGSGIE